MGNKLGLVDYIKLLFNGRPALEAAISEGKILVTEARTAGIKTIGFWAAALAGVGTVGLQVAGLIAPPWGAIVATSCAAIYAISRGLIKRDDPLGGLKPFASTSEAWLNIISAVSNVLLAVKGVVSPQTAATLAAVNAGILGLSQSLAQSGAQPASSTNAPAQAPQQ